MKASLAVVSLVVLLPTWVSAQNGLLTGESQWIDLEIDGNVAYPHCINSSGEIAGSYEVDAVGHGFLRSPDGTYETFEISGSYGPWITGINTSGAITGSYQDGIGTHGFIRNPDGTVVSFDAPGSEGYDGTEPIAINDSGIVVGNVGLDSSPYLIFIRHTDGSFEEFDPNILFRNVTASAEGFNNSGVIVGTTANPVDYGFLITPRGHSATLLAYLQQGFGTYNLKINASNIVTGIENDEAFIMQPGSPPVSFAYPGATVTEPAAINSKGVIAGSYFIPGAYHGFLRDLRGGIVSVNFPNAIETFIMGINDNGWLIGQYVDQTFTYRAFLRIPGRQR